MNEQEVKVFAVFGYAIYVCQALEEAVIHALVTIVYIPREQARMTAAGLTITADQLKHTAEKLAYRASKRKLADLMKTLADHGLPEAWAAWLRQARFRRNYLAHRFFRDNWKRMQTAEGRYDLLIFLHVMIFELEHVIAGIREIEEQIAKENAAATS